MKEREGSQLRPFDEAGGEKEEFCTHATSSVPYPEEEKKSSSGKNRSSCVPLLPVETEGEKGRETQSNLESHLLFLLHSLPGGSSLDEGRKEGGL